MKNFNLYECQIPDCQNKCKIRTKIKDQNSEYYGLLVCTSHANQFRLKKTSDKTRRTQKARQEQRKDYPEFYQKMIEISKKKNCEECGKKLQGNSTEIVHILAKRDSMSPEVATNPLNIIFLCGDCHTKYDKNLSARSTMEKAMEKSISQYKELEPFLKNRTSETLFFDKYLT